MQNEKYFDYVDQGGKLVKKFKPLVKISAFILIITIISLGAFTVLVTIYDVTPKTKIENPCSDSYITTYNQLQRQTSSGENNRLIDDIESIKDHADDPNCIFMLTKLYLSEKNFDKATAYYDSYVELNSKGKYANGQISDISSTESLKLVLNNAKGTNSNSSGTGVSGSK